MCWLLQLTRAPPLPLCSILIAFIIEAFLLQLEYDASPLEDIVDEKIRSELEKSP